MPAEKQKPFKGIKETLQREPGSQWLSLNHSDHLVQFYEDDGYLVESVAVFLGSGFGNDEAAIVIATPEHRLALSRQLVRFDLDVAALEATGQLLFADAEATLATFLVDGWPDENRFNREVGGMVARALDGRRGLRAFGEMVAILWARGRGDAALRLEELWNGLGRTCAFSLYCAYPMAAFKGLENGNAFADICSAHAHVIPAETCSDVHASPNEHLRSVALLQQKASSLEKEAQERRRAEEASRRLAAIVESSFDAIISKDLDGVIASWNHAAERLFGYPSAEAVGKHITMLIPEELLSEEGMIMGRIKAGERVESFETVRRRKDGSKVEVSLTVSPIKDAEGVIVGASKIARDITERRRYETALAEKEDQLRQAAKMEAVGKLAGGIAHDFNNLLTAINGYSEMALTMVSGDPALMEYLQEIKKSGDRAASLTQQLLAYSRKQILAPSVFNLNAAVAEMDRMLRRLIGEDIEVNTVLEPDLGMVKADPGQVQQIILNLVLNARDAMPQGGRLTLETGNRVLDAGHVASHPESNQGPHVMLAVRDTGIGMDESVRARIFEPFFTTKEVGKGTGLGLSSVYGILKQSSGSISVESEPGKGSTFRIFLPLAASEIAAAAPDRKPGGGESAGRRTETILLVEDEETVRKFVSRTLAARGYTILEARDGATAMAVGRKQPGIDLLLTDVVMPNMNGTRLAEQLKTIQPGLKVLFMSGYPDNHLKPHGFQEESVKFLQKPFGQAIVAAMVREMLEPAASTKRTQA